MYLKTAGQVANSVDPDQMPHFVASDLGLHYALGQSIPIFKVYNSMYIVTCAAVQYFVVSQHIVSYKNIIQYIHRGLVVFSPPL